jgi:hypothetical protein
MNQRPPSDDLQPGEHDNDIHHIKLPTHHNFTVWYLDENGNDKSSPCVAENEYQARWGIINSDIKMQYVIRVEKGSPVK